MRIHTVLAVAWKELAVRAKDRGSLAVLFILPLLFGSILGSTFGRASSDGDNEDPGLHIGVYVVNDDQGAYGEQVVATLREMQVLELDTTVDAAAADQLVGEGKKLAAVIIPANFSERIDAYEQATVRVLVDPTQEEYASIVTGLVNYAVTPATVQGEVQYGIRTLLDEAGVLQGDPEQYRAAVAQSTGVIMTQLQAMQEQPAISVESEAVTGAGPSPVTNIFSLVMPGMSVAFAFWVTGIVGSTLHQEKDQGTMRRLLSAPVSRGEIIAGNILAYLAIVFLQVVVLFGVASGVFNMPLGDEPLGLFLVTLALGLSVSAFGLMVGSLTRSGKQADSICTVLGFVLGGLSGALIVTWPPFYRVEGFMGTLSRLTPHAHALEGYTLLMIDRASLSEALPQVGILLLYTLIFAAVATSRIRLMWR
jgi:ABC-2 type transport system permease protein